MSFLQPLLLAGLPLIGLPILIHLIHRQRHRTVPWAAMMFLLDAERLTRGTAKLRYWLIMAMRMLAVAALILAVARPLASGWLGLTVGGQPDTTILILDRSASMEQQEIATGQSKRSTGLQKLAQLTATLGAGTQLVLVESTENRAQHLDSAQELLASPATTATSTQADIPGMLQTALDYVVNNETGSTDIWICSDLRTNDWRPEDGRWRAIRDGFAEREGVRFYLLTYSETARENVSVRVTNVRRRELGDSAELVLDLALRRETDRVQPLKVPLDIVINGARSVLNLELQDRELTVQGHAIGLDGPALDGWGFVQLPADGNPRDNRGFFVYAEPPEHRTVIVSSDRRAAEALRLAAVSPKDPALKYAADVLAPERVGEIDWEAASMILWQAPLPDESVARQLLRYVERGRPVICFPDEAPGDRRIADVGWGAWLQAPANQPRSVATWRGDSDLLQNTRDGTALPIGELRMFRYCEIDGDGSVLARLDDGNPLLSRIDTQSGPLYFCATLPRADCSSLVQEGVAFYVMLQRALSIGVATQGNARQLDAGSSAAAQVQDWTPLATAADDAASTARPYHAGAYESEGLWIALNRPEQEDLARPLNAAALPELLQGLEYRQVEDRVGSASALVTEIWRAFLIVMALALIVEACLCFPERKRVAEATLLEMN